LQFAPGAVVVLLAGIGNEPGANHEGFPMSNVLSRGVLVAALVGLVAGPLRSTACEPPGEVLTLKSAYSAKPMVDGARQVRLQLRPDASGGGSGTLTLDPNIVDDLGSTCIALTEIPVRVRRILDDEAAAKGRRVYELNRVEEEGKEGLGRWLLIKPLKAGAPSSLVFVERDGKIRDVVVVE
jgi:hypothetical protein